MPSTRTHKLLWLAVALLVPIGLLLTLHLPYALDGDAVAYLDLAEYLRHHNWPAVINGYWNPGYPAVLALAEVLLRSTRANELRAAYLANASILLANAAAALWFASALTRLRQRLSPKTFLLDTPATQLLLLALVLFSAQRELLPSFVRPDALLQALLLAAAAALAESLALPTLLFPALTGFAFGLAYLTKSVAFPLALLAVLLLAAFTFFTTRNARSTVLKAALALLSFTLAAGPYIAALSHQKHRFDFGDSGSLNYAWYAAGVEKMHLEPSMTAGFAHSEVHLLHPERQLLASPPVYSYRAQPLGTYPDWFDTTFFNERISPHLNLPVLLHRDLRNLVLVLRYLFDHPEGWLLLLLLPLATGARFAPPRDLLFTAPFLLLGLTLWLLYGLVNIEERYVTLAWLLLLLPAVTAFLPAAPGDSSRRIARGMVATLAFVALGQMLHTAFELRREQTSSTHPAWQDAPVFPAAAALAQLGLHPGDPVACMGALACLNDHYWARLAGLQITTEIYNPNPPHLLAQWEALPNRHAILDTLRHDGARALVAELPFDSDNGETPDALGWIRLGASDLYALPLAPGLNPGPNLPALLLPWNTIREGGP